MFCNGIRPGSSGIANPQLQMLKRRATNEKASEMREHPSEARNFGKVAPVAEITGSSGRRSFIFKMNVP
jgi:hypothetical protein